jgi:hypothetical protein
MGDGIRGIYASCKGKREVRESEREMVKKHERRAYEHRGLSGVEML